jgi:NAD(P)-dependent dehydrogenase (short-subunit alcohol dehydrogenase family)
LTRLGGQAAVVTGAASGIGRAIAEALAAEGAAVAVCDRDGGLATEVAAGIEAAGGHAAAVEADVTRADEVEALVRGVVERHGRLDVLVNSAGYCQVKPFLDLTEEDMRRMWEVHALGTFLCSRAALPAMLERRYGRIVNVVSGPNGYGVSPWTTHYQAAKSAQTSVGRSLAAAFGAEGLTVNCVSPGLVVTPLWDRLDADYRATFGRTAAEEIDQRLSDRESFPLGRPVEPAEVARVVTFLALPESGAINGEVINL